MECMQKNEEVEGHILEHEEAIEIADDEGGDALVGESMRTICT